MRKGDGLLATRRMRRTLAIVAFVVLGVFLPLHHLLNRTNPLPQLSPEERATRNLGVLRTALECFHRDCSRYPTDAEGLLALVRNPAVPHWRGPYLRLLMPDPWRNDYFYGYTNKTVTLSSNGPDGMPGTADDIPAPPPDLAYVQATATNAPYQARGEDTFVEILTRPPGKGMRPSRVDGAPDGLVPPESRRGGIQWPARLGSRTHSPAGQAGRGLRHHVLDHPAARAYPALALNFALEIEITMKTIAALVAGCFLFPQIKKSGN